MKITLPDMPDLSDWSTSLPETEEELQNEWDLLGDIEQRYQHVVDTIASKISMASDFRVRKSKLYDEIRKHKTARLNAEIFQDRTTLSTDEYGT